MIDLGTVRPGSTIRIPFSTYDSNDPQASAAITGYATSDIKIYKDGSTTERASTSGYTATTSFDTLVGINEAVVDLSDNTTAGFYAAGSEYVVVVADVTLDAATVRKAIGRFTIGYPDAVINTTIATLSTQTSFTLTSGPAEDDALNGHWVLIHDVASAVQIGKALITDYVGSTKTVTLAAGTTFTVAATDNISIMGTIDANVVQWLGTAPATPTTAGVPEVDTTYVSGTAQTANDNGADINTLVTRVVGTIAAGTHNPQSGDAYAIVNNGTYGNAQLVRSTTPANTLDITPGGTAGINWGNIENPTAVVDLSATDMNLVDTATTVTNQVTANTTQIEGVDATDQINAACDASIETYNLHYVLHTALPTNWTTDITANSAIDYIVDDGTSTFDRVTDSIQAIRDRGDSAWTTGGGGSSSPDLLQSTTIATLASQTIFTLTAGSSDDNTYRDAMAIVTDSVTSTQKAFAIISAYTGSTKTVTLDSDPAIFPMAIGDSIDIVAIPKRLPLVTLTETTTTNSDMVTEPPTATENADTLLNRDMAAVSDTNSRTPLNALRFLRNYWNVSGSTLTVRKEDDSTVSWTATLSTDAAANPVTGSDPT